MPNFRLHLDLLDFYIQLKEYNITEFRMPFCLYFIEASDPDEACSLVVFRLCSILMKVNSEMKTRILCRKIRKKMRIDKIEAL